MQVPYPLSSPQPNKHSSLQITITGPHFFPSLAAAAAFPLPLNVNESLVLLLMAAAADNFPVAVTVVDSITAIDLRRITSSRAFFSVVPSPVRSALRRLVGDDSERNKTTTLIEMSKE